MEEAQLGMSIRRVAPVVVLLAVAAVIYLGVRLPTRDPKPYDPIEWTVNPPASAPQGDAFRIGRAPSPAVVRWRGTYSYEQSTSGRFGTENTIPTRTLAGSFTAIESSSGPLDSESGSVDATFDMEETIQSVKPAKRAVHAKLSFDRGADGTVVHRSIRLDAPPDVKVDLEVFQYVWTQRFSVPKRPVRVGERLPIDECLDLDDAFRRPLWFLFKERAAKAGPISEPVEGGVWIESKDEALGGSVRVRALLTHAHVGVNGPDGPNAVRIDYRAVLDGDRTIGIADGSLRRHALTLARRIRYSSRDLDYAVVVRAKISMERDPTAN